MWNLKYVYEAKFIDTENRLVVARGRRWEVKKMGELCCFVFGHTLQLAGSQFPKQVLNPSYRSENTES